jgi:hypothetical protein
MLSDDALVDLVKSSFEADVRSVAVPLDLPVTVRRQLQRRRRGVAAALSATAVAACTVGIVFAVTQAGPARPTQPAAASGTGLGPVTETGGTKLLQLSGFTFRLSANAATALTCLRADTRSWINSWSAAPSRRPVAFRLLINGGNGGGDPHAEPCTGAAFVPSRKHPAAVDTVRAPGQRPVYVAAPTASARVGYLALNARDSAAFAGLMGGPVGPRYYLIGEIAAGNDQSVLVAMLRQFPLPNDARRPQHDPARATPAPSATR